MASRASGEFLPTELCPRHLSYLGPVLTLGGEVATTILLGKETDQVVQLAISGRVGIRTQVLLGPGRGTCLSSTPWGWRRHP